MHNFTQNSSPINVTERNFRKIINPNKSRGDWLAGNVQKMKYI